MKAVSCKDCKGKGKIRQYISPPDLDNEDSWQSSESIWTEFLKKLKKKTEHVECRNCEGTGFEGHKKVEFQSIKHETEKSILFVINKKEIWVAKSIIVKKDDKMFVVPRWTKLFTQEEWYQYRTRAKFAREEFEQDYWDSFGYDPSDFF